MFIRSITPVRGTWARSARGEYRGPVNIEPRWTFEIVARKLTTWQGFAWADRYKHPEFVPDEHTGKPPVELRYPA